MRVRTPLIAVVAIAVSLVPTGAVGARSGATGTCPDGSVACVSKTITQMNTRFDRMLKTCDHNLIFALSYLLTTQGYKAAVADPHFFNDNPWVNVEDWQFADLYTSAKDAYDANPLSTAVPPAWRVAFDAARNESVSGAGDLLLGINAHVNRDLPFVLVKMGLVAPNGTSRKPDHDKVDVILHNVLQEVLDQESRRFDPTVPNDVVAGTTLDTDALFQLIVGWRESAWQHAALLASTPPALRGPVIAEIEQESADEARMLKNSATVTRAQARARDAWCAAHKFD